jgi:hypothetical protein
MRMDRCILVYWKITNIINNTKTVYFTSYGLFLFLIIKENNYGTRYICCRTGGI